ncbi:hypothetical protein [Enterococcus sp. AZ109]|uniref:hypothetical protein n=1 Tax=Enterococcus sp. AZ109 TaxID=2774634 RepID=UPI003F1EC784
MKNKKVFYSLLCLFIGLSLATGFALKRVHDQVEKAQATIESMTNEPAEEVVEPVEEPVEEPPVEDIPAEGA